MNELIPIKTNEQMEPVISGRDLHEFLEVGTRYDTWFERMKEYGFENGKDYTEVTEEVDAQKRARTYEQINHALKLDMAKEISMIQRNEKGKQARQYFIAVEKEYNSPEKIMARALRIADETINNLKLVNSNLVTQTEIMTPKAEYFDEMVDRNLLTSFRDTAKMYEVKEKIFISFLIEKKYIYRDGKGKLTPYADKNNGLFEIKESINNKTGWSGTQTMITPKGRETFRLLVQGLN